MSSEDADPYLCAMMWSCAWCGAEAYATDASWLAGDLVLATYAQPHRGECRGLRTWSAIVDPVSAVLGRQLVTMKSPPTKNARLVREYYRHHSCKACGVLAAARYCDSCRCRETTKQGRRCANRARTGGLCCGHGGDQVDQAVTVGPGSPNNQSIFTREGDQL